MVFPANINPEVSFPFPHNLHAAAFVRIIAGVLSVVGQRGFTTITRISAGLVAFTTQVPVGTALAAQFQTAILSNLYVVAGGFRFNNLNVLDGVLAGESFRLQVNDIQTGLARDPDGLLVGVFDFT